MTKATDRKSPPLQLFLGNVAFQASTDDVRQALEGRGIRIDAVRLGVNQDTGHSRGFAFIDISPEEPRSVDQLIAEVTGVLICGRPCRADVARSPQVQRRPPERKVRGGPRDSFDRAWVDDD